MAKTPKSLAGRAVKNLRCHVGFGNVGKLSCNIEVDKSYMELTPVGVYVEVKNKTYLVPYPNVTWCELEGDEK